MLGGRALGLEILVCRALKLAKVREPSAAARGGLGVQTRNKGGGVEGSGGRTSLPGS